MALTKLSGTSSTVAKPRSVRVLYVEDEDQNWEIAQLSLRDRYTLERAKDSKEAFAKLRTGAFAAILMDIQLAGSDLNGIEITQVLRGGYQGKIPEYAVGYTLRDTPIIFVTAYNARYTKEELMAYGGNDLLPKPVDFMRLALSISKYLVRQVSRVAVA